MESKYWIRSKGEYYYFQLLAPNGQHLVQSISYDTKGECLDGILIFQNRIRSGNNFEIFRRKNGEYEFRIASLVKSEGYSSIMALRNGIRDVRQYGLTDKVEDK